MVDAAAAGRVLLATAGVAVVGFAPLLGPDESTWRVLIAVSVAVVGLAALSAMLPWTRLPSRASLVFPSLVCAALVSLGVSSPGFAAPLTGVLTLCFAYIGLTQPPKTAAFCLPVAAVTVLCTYARINGPVIVRLCIALFVWTLLAEILARLMLRLYTLTTTLAGAAHHDELTGVPNRRDLELRLATSTAGDTIVMCDIDHFKRINDTRGHAAGDQVLADFGAMLRVALRDRDYGARYGGEEFLLLLPATSTRQARPLLDRLQQHWATLQPGITFSAGVATVSPQRSATETRATADTMLYAAKVAGRNRVVTEFDDTDISTPTVHHRQL